MLPTTSLGWNGLQALKSRLAGRLARFTRDRPPHDCPHKFGHGSDFLEDDLRYIFVVTPASVDISENSYHDMDQKAQSLLSLLDEVVNGDFVKSAIEACRQEVPENTHDEHPHLSHGVAILDGAYPRLSALARVLETTTDEVNLTSGPGLPLFILPHEEVRRRAKGRVAEWKAFLARLSSHENRGMQATSQPETHLVTTKSICDQGSPIHLQASIVVDTIFKEFQQLNCDIPHEIKLRISEELHINPRQSTFDMFISSCTSETTWQETQCGPFQVAADLHKNHDICTAVQISQERRRKLHLSIDQRGLFDVSGDMLPIVATHVDWEHTKETLDHLLEQKWFSPIRYSDRLRKPVAERFGRQKKATLALALARCLMDFFDKELELASYTWNPEKIFFLPSSEAHINIDQPYVSLRPNLSGSRSPDSFGAIQIGHPLVLSFARLLLEIDDGEKIPLTIHPRSEDNIQEWASLCSHVSALQNDDNHRSNFYLEAVQGCLYLHLHLRKLRDQAAASSSVAAMRKIIYDNVVYKLELEVNPKILKRKRRGSSSELPSGKKPSTLWVPGAESQNAFKAPESTGAARSSDDSVASPPTSRRGFEVAIVCALPLEYDAISLLIDQFWDEEGDRYGRAIGDENTYTTGRMGIFNVVLVLLPNMGKASAAGSTASLRSSFPGLRLVLLTGICGGVPNSGTDRELLLGDVVVGNALIQYDFGRRCPDGFTAKRRVEDSLSRLPKNIRNFVAVFETRRARNSLEKRAARLLEQIQSDAFTTSAGQPYHYPGADNDRLFHPGFRHKHHLSPQCACASCHGSLGPVCEESRMLPCDTLGCNTGETVLRKRLEKRRWLERVGRTKEAQAPSVFVGRIGSGDTVLKSGEDRDRIAKDHNILAFEMEGAGAWDEIPCIVVKGVCDYADSHKNKDWQDFAAAAAASVAKALLERYPRTDNSSKPVQS
ncbi:hypothetical protein B0T10DRAFT_602101 [Thelonectria olida]|uniref:Nucleoside phosphorylase domain-containing protein n=1 Tax=Thelonectria olida TaxID=1576542 RepID=A0A9P9AWV9_9HYPO|nr:hypothetical protein B0T10DRAFT_602101 [Thelonectria olida]